MRKYLLIILMLITQFSCLNEKQQAEKILRHYIDVKVDLIRNYSMESSVALWNATVSGSDTDYQKFVDIDLDFNKSNRKTPDYFSPDRFSSFSQNVFTNEQDFQLLRKLKFSGLITDTLLNRQLNVLYHTFMGSQIETEKYKGLVMNELKLWQEFSELEVVIRGKKYGTGQLDSIRKKTNDALLLNDISDAIKQKGQSLAPDIVRMVKDRNGFVAHFGYPDFYQMSLETKDQTPKIIKLLLAEIELKTRNEYFEAKSVIDKLLAKRFNISVSDLQPWNYNNELTSFLPPKFISKMDSLFLDIDPIQKTALFFEEIGLPIQDVIDNSDLKVGPGKSGLTAMINVDFRNDVRLIAGIENSYDGMFRMMHLGGHAAHYKNISDDIPYLLKTPNSALGEGIAHYFGNLVSDYNWLKSEVKLDESKPSEFVLVCQHMQQVDRLFRCRKLLVNAEFEREIYQNPDQDLDSLWSDLNLKYLGFRFPDEKNACYWATNKFNVSLGCTVHNLVLADVFAAQLQHSVEVRVLKETNGVYTNNKAVGTYLIGNLFHYGNLLPWDQLIEKATGEPLNSTYLVNQLVGNNRTKNKSMKK